MANRIILDGVDITSDLQQQAAVDTVEDFVPSGSQWFNLLPIIAKHSSLKESFFTSNIHTLAIQSDSMASSAKMFIKAKYTARNR